MRQKTSRKTTNFSWVIFVLITVTVMIYNSKYEEFGMNLYQSAVIGVLFTYLMGYLKSTVRAFIKDRHARSFGCIKTNEGTWVHDYTVTNVIPGYFDNKEISAVFKYECKNCGKKYTQQETEYYR